MMEDEVGILVVAHGTVESLDDLPAFLQRVRHGRPASEKLISELRDRYQKIGGSPLLRHTVEQAEALHVQTGFRTFVAMRLWEPSIPKVLATLPCSLRRLCVVPLAPFSVEIYIDAVRQGLASLSLARPPELRGVAPWGRQPALIRAHIETIVDCLEGTNSTTQVVLTAHSLPTRVIEQGDQYATQVRECAEAVGAGLSQPWTLAYQSPGADGGSWLGPSLQEVLHEVRNEGATGVVVAPIGFLAEHVETLYDLDVEARGWAEQLGLEWRRAPALNQHSGLIQAMAASVHEALIRNA